MRPLLPGIVVGMVVLGLVLGAAWWANREAPAHAWSTRDVATLRSLSLASLPPLPPDPSNAVGDDPRAVEFGHRLFFDTRFSGNGEVSCATCHKPERAFTDGLPRSEAIGTTKRHAPSIVGMAYSPWYFWDGRRDSQWAQAISPMEDPKEHGGTRTQYAHLIAAHYREPYEALFGRLPPLSRRIPLSAGPLGNEAQQAAWSAMTPKDRDAVNRVFANIGKAIAAYERRLLHGPSRFDRYVEAVVAGDEAAMQETFSEDEARGLALFIGDANCTECHNGPLLTNNGFHNIGLPPEPGVEFDQGRTGGVPQMLDFTFNCLSEYSDAGPDECDELRFVKKEGLELLGAFKVPSLRNVGITAPYMHTGQFASLGEVLEHYNEAPTPLIGHSDLVQLALTPERLARLEAFLGTLGGPIAAPGELLTPPAP